MENKGPDERYLVRFQQDENGNYADYYGCIRKMLGRRAYVEHSINLGGHSGGYFVAWCEDPHIKEARVRFGSGPVQSIAVKGTPEMIVLYDENSYVTEYTFHAADGRELM